jgi:hypothetical protein
MPTTLRNTDILFNDGTTQGTAATAGGLVTTANVLNATAGLTAGEVGTYAFLYDNTNSDTDINQGATIAGSNLRFTAVFYFTPWIVATNGQTPSGTWRLMGFGRRSGSEIGRRYASLFVRIS